MNETVIDVVPIKRRKGRPCKMTPQCIKILCDAIGRGLPANHACAIAGVSFQTFSSFRNMNAAFAQVLNEATARGVEKRLQQIIQASDTGDWRASAWLLERTQPDSFARSRLEVTGANGAPLSANVRFYLPQKESAVVETIVDVSVLENGGGHD